MKLLRNDKHIMYPIAAGCILALFLLANNAYAGERTKEPTPHVEGWPSPPTSKENNPVESSSDAQAASESNSRANAYSNSIASSGDSTSDSTSNSTSKGGSASLTSNDRFLSLGGTTAPYVANGNVPCQVPGKGRRRGFAAGFGLVQMSAITVDHERCWEMLEMDQSIQLVHAEIELERERSRRIELETAIIGPK